MGLILLKVAGSFNLYFIFFTFPIWENDIGKFQDFAIAIITIKTWYLGRESNPHDREVTGF